MVRFMCCLLEERGYWDGWHMYIFGNKILYILVICRVCMFHPTSQSHSAVVTPRAQVYIYHLSPMLICQKSFLWPAWIWIVSCAIFCHEVEMLLLIDSADDVAIANMNTSHPA